MIQPLRRVERRNRKISSCRPRTGCSLPFFTHRLEPLFVVGHFWSHFWSFFFFANHFWSFFLGWDFLKALRLAEDRFLLHWLPSCWADLPNCRRIHQTMPFSLYRGRMKAEKVKNLAKRRRPGKRRHRILDIFRLARTFLAYGSFVILQSYPKKWIYWMLWVQLHKPPKNLRVKWTHLNMVSLVGPLGNVWAIAIWAIASMYFLIEELRLRQSFSMCCLTFFCWGRMSYMHVS